MYRKHFIIQYILFQQESWVKHAIQKKIIIIKKKGQHNNKGEVDVLSRFQLVVCHQMVIAALLKSKGQLINLS